MTRRTSARGASAKKRYTVDAFEGIEGLQDSGSDHSPVRRSRDSDSGDEFHIESEPADAAEEDEDDFSVADDEPEGHSDLGSDAGEQDLDDAMSIAATMISNRKTMTIIQLGISVPRIANQRYICRGLTASWQSRKHASSGMAKMLCRPVGNYKNLPRKIALTAIGKSTALNRAWVQPQAEGFKAVPKHASATKAGFILNLGVKVKCVEWAPNQPGSSQYLATSTLPRPGCANGCVAVFDLTKTSVSGIPRPSIYTSVASGYILSITSCYPSHQKSFPHHFRRRLPSSNRPQRPNARLAFWHDLRASQPVWFMHEWRRPTQPELEGQQSTPKPVGNNGLSRFVEGFKVEQGQRTYREGSMQNSDDKDHGLHFHTVHEEETGVSAMSWNPNKECGTWAAAGLASGLLRVEDLAAC
ncbi:hypothetical protein L1887_63495 [Cichorium endivia]|nr:hypothetical protein L1887_63495 [Cichorium endivia]